MKKRGTMVFLLAGALFLFTAVPAQALQFGFYNITGNNAGDAAIGEAQLFVDVTDAGSNQVLFTFENSGLEASSICDVYFDDGDGSRPSLISVDSIDNSWTGVSFSQWAKPKNLPGANDADPDFKTTAGFSADSDPEVQPNGVNPGEYLGILFNLQSNLENVYTQLASGDLRIGIHVQGFESEGSESFVNNPYPVPEPATMLLFGSGLVGFVVSQRKKSRK